MSAPRRLLVISPVFHGYWQAISQGFEANGCDVVTHCYDAGTSRTLRVTNALAHRLPGSGAGTRARVEKAWTQECITRLREVKPDAVFVVKGDALGQEWWDALRESGVPSSLWLYDELENMRYTTGFLAQLPRVFSYSKVDVDTLRTAGVNVGFLPSAFDSFATFTTRTLEAVSFVGARYEERETLLTAMADAGTEVRAFGREWSRHPWDVIRTRKWKAAPFPVERDLSRMDYYGVMAGSTATLNVHGSHHNGLSMRTFEAPGVGALSLIDRESVAEFYDPGAETLVFSSTAEAVELVQRAEREPTWAESVRAAGRARTLADHTWTQRLRTVLDEWR